MDKKSATEDAKSVKTQEKRLAQLRAKLPSMSEFISMTAEARCAELAPFIDFKQYIANFPKSVELKPCESKKCLIKDSWNELCDGCWSGGEKSLARAVSPLDAPFTENYFSARSLNKINVEILLMVIYYQSRERRPIWNLLYKYFGELSQTGLS